MSSFKRLNAEDVFVTPYVAHKSWSFSYASVPTSSNAIVVYHGQNNTASFDVNTFSTTSLGEYQSLIYASINHQFYGQYTGSLNTHSIMMTATNYVSASSQRQTSSYFIINENPGYVEATLSSSFDVISVSRNIYGEGIKPYSFQLNLSGSIITDDGIGNLNTSGLHIGNILYSQGLAIFTSGSVTYPLTASFQSSYTIYENNIICTVKDSEYNLTYNPSLLSSSMTLTSSVKDFATGSTFVPYVTTVGIYNDANELLMVAKLATPMPISKDTDMSFIIKYDT